LDAREGRRGTRRTIAKPAIGGVMGNQNVMSREMQLFDEFLERVVRPLVEARLK
jgi:hypothetical protein